MKTTAAPKSARAKSPRAKPAPVMKSAADKSNGAKSAADIDKIIGRHIKELQKPGVLSVRPGYQAAGHWLTKKRAIVVTVDQKRDNVSPQNRLPESLEGVAVDVREAGELHKVRTAQLAAGASMPANVPPELSRPTFKYERVFDGQTLSAAAAPAAARRPSKPQLKYEGPDDASLKAYQGAATITCHASPDAGWPTLKAFLAKTRAGLTVGMYDFTSAHILEEVKDALGSGKDLNLVLDHPAPNPSRDQTDDQTVDDLRQAIKGFSFAWALERMDPFAAKWIFPNAYHIKVAVRDSNAFWLSSGNWNNSNQPDMDPINDPQRSDKAKAAKSDRDWHVVVENAKPLAGVFEAYLKNDLDVADKNQTEPAGAAAQQEAMEDELAAVAARAPSKYFPPKTISGNMKLQPLLTPDNYEDFILPLIESTQSSFYMQTQYIHPLNNGGDDEVITKLINAVVKLINDGKDVRLIMSQYETQDWLERIQDAGIDLRVVKVQRGVHNKGIVVDGKTVVVSSQNWSGDGVANNRDAGLIIYNEDAAQYWQGIFLHDWNNMAQQKAAE
jgi:hypothetical protein